jgi:hypothetical protein
MCLLREMRRLVSQQSCSYKVDVTFLNSSPNGKETYYIDDQLFMYRIVLAILEASLVASFSCRRLLFSFV